MEIRNNLRHEQHQKKCTYRKYKHDFVRWTVAAFGGCRKGAEGASISNIWDAFWYAIITLTTVGYGDYFPVTIQGKVVALVFVIASLGLLGYLISNLTSRIQRYMELKRQGHYGTDFQNHFVIFGWDKFGQFVTEQIINAGNQVSIITNEKDDIDLIEDLYPKDLCFILFSDYHNFDVIKKSNLESARTVFINFADDTETLVYLINLKKQFPDLNYVVSIENPDLKETYKAIGTTYTISKNEIASKLVASYIFEPDVASFTEDIITTAVDEDELDMKEYLIKENNPYANEAYMDVFVDVKTKYNCVLLGLKKKEKLIKNPSSTVQVEPGDYVILITDEHTKEALEGDFHVGEGVQH